MAAQAHGYWADLGLQVAGPLVTALVGSLVVGLIVAKIARRSQDQRADRALRIALIDSMAKVSGAMYIRSQAYWRWKEGLTAAGVVEDATTRKPLDEAYEQMQIDGASIEAQLRAYFAETEVAEYWHSATDCLTIRYFTLVLAPGSDAVQRLYDANARDHEGRTHSGLQVRDMADRSTVVRAYFDWRDRATSAVANRPIRRPT